MPAKALSARVLELVRKAVKVLGIQASLGMAMLEASETALPDLARMISRLCWLHGIDYLTKGCPWTKRMMSAVGLIDDLLPEIFRPSGSS